MTENYQQVDLENYIFCKFQCHTHCTSIYEIPDILNFTTPTGPIKILSGDYITVECENSEHVVNDTWKNNYVKIKCLHSGQFEQFGE